MEEQRAPTIVGGPQPEPVTTVDNLKSQIAKLQSDLEAEYERNRAAEEDLPYQEYFLRFMEEAADRLGNSPRLERLVALAKQAYGKTPA